MLDVGGAQPLVFLAVDIPLALFCRPALFIDVETAIDALDEAKLVVSIEDVKVLGQPCLLPVSTQQAMGETVESPDPHAAEGLANQFVDATAHFPGRLVGEGHGQYAEGGDLFGLYQPGDPVHQYARLAASCSSQHQQMGCRAGYRIALLIVEGIQYMRDIHGGLF